MPEIVINDYKYQFTPRYAEGHTVNAAEAETLNAALAKRVAAAFGQKGRNAVKKGTAFDVSQEAFDAYASGFALGQGRPRTGRGQKDPVRAEGYRMLRESLAFAFKQEGAGRKVADYATPEWLAQMYDSRPDIQEAAKRSLADKQALIASAGLPPAVPATLPEGSSTEPQPEPQPEPTPEPVENGRERGGRRR